jgi:23S rRNA (adenine2503-C2)-methyltransferase
MTTRYAATHEELAAWCSERGLPRYRVDQVLDALYAQRIPLEDASPLPRALRGELAEAFPLAFEAIVVSTGDDGQTVKWLWRGHGDAQVETVLMRYPERATVCVSSQAGCAMGCTFCATGQAGFVRHLDAGEIVEQVRVAPAGQQRRVHGDG